MHNRHAHRRKRRQFIQTTTYFERADFPCHCVASCWLPARPLSACPPVPVSVPGTAFSRPVLALVLPFVPALGVCPQWRPVSPTPGWFLLFSEPGSPLQCAAARFQLEEQKLHCFPPRSLSLSLCVSLCVACEDENEQDPESAGGLADSSSLAIMTCRAQMFTCVW